MASSIVVGGTRAFFSIGFSIGFSKKIALVPPTGNFALEFSTLSLTMNQTKKLNIGTKYRILYLTFKYRIQT